MASVAIDDLRAPFPSRRAAQALRERIVRHLLRTRPAAGTPFHTDAEWGEKTGLSRSTVRRALDLLHQEGWIERQAGRGTFVGPRVALLNGATPARQAGPGRVIRMAVVVFEIGDAAHDWYTPLVMEGMDAAAEAQGLAVELLGNRDRDVDAISRRLAQTQPDVLVCLSADPRAAFVIRDAQKLGIPCLLAGTPHMALGLPGVCEDNRQAMTLAVRHLVDHGHRRIGLAMTRSVQPWVVERHEAYGVALRAAGLPADETFVHWFSIDEPREGRPETTRRFHEYLGAATPTAIVLGDYRPLRHLENLARGGTIRVPRDLSVVTFEQDLAPGQWLGVQTVTGVMLPIRQMGRRLAGMAREVAEGGAARMEMLAAEMRPGDTVIEVPAQ